jgi:hypothetical protein
MFGVREVDEGVTEDWEQPTCRLTQITMADAQNSNGFFCMIALLFSDNSTKNKSFIRTLIILHERERIYNWDFPYQLIVSLKLN